MNEIKTCPFCGGKAERGYLTGGIPKMLPMLEE